VISYPDLPGFLVPWVNKVRTAFEARVAPELTVPVFRVGVLENGTASAKVASEIGRRLFDVEPRHYLRTGPVALFDYQGMPPEALNRRQKPERKSQTP
jgi:hypothetical protein